MEKKGKFIQVFTTTEKKKDAGNIAGILLQKRLAACVQIMPVESVYRWKGRIEKNREYLCIIKSRSALYNKIAAEIKENHPYELPEIVVSPLSGGSKKYMQWIEDSTKPGD